MGRTYPFVVGLAALMAVPYDKNRSSLGIANMGAAIVYYGWHNDVTAANGFPIVAGTGITFSRAFGDDPTLALWMISGAAGMNCRVSEEWVRGAQ